MGQFRTGKLVRRVHFFLQFFTVHSWSPTVYEVNAVNSHSRSCQSHWVSFYWAIYILQRGRKPAQNIFPQLFKIHWRIHTIFMNGMGWDNGIGIATATAPCGSGPFEWHAFDIYLSIFILNLTQSCFSFVIRRVSWADKTLHRPAGLLVQIELN